MIGYYESKKSFKVIFRERKELNYNIYIGFF